MSYITKSLDPEIRIFVGVKYEQKDEAKKCGAKWDSTKKKWYFEYKFGEFEGSNDAHTFNYKPYDFKIAGCDCEDNERIRYFQILKNRNLEYIQKLETNYNLSKNI